MSDRGATRLALAVGGLAFPLLIAVGFRLFPLGDRECVLCFASVLAVALILSAAAARTVTMASTVGLYRLATLVSLAMALVVLFHDGWDRHALRNDSRSYAEPPGPKTSNRPPVYPLFIRLVNLGRDIDPKFTGVPRQVILENGESPVALRIVRGQKLALLASFLLLAAALMRYLPPPVVALCLLCFARWRLLFAHEVDFVLSEALSQAVTYTLVAVFLLFVRKERRIHLPLAGLLVGLLVLARTPGVFAGVVLAAMCLLGLLRGWRRHLAFVVGAAVAASIVFIPGLLIYKTYGFFAFTARDGVPMIMNALQVATPEDVAHMPDDESRRFLAEALARKKERDRIVIDKAGRPRADIPEFAFIDSNFYEVASPMARAKGLSTVRSIPLYRKVSGPILDRHRGDRLRNIQQALGYATSDRTRLVLRGNEGIFLSFWHFMAACAVLAALGRWRYSLCGIVLILCHLAHLAVVCAKNAPLTRYVYSTEGLVVLGAVLIAAGFANKRSPKKDRA